MFLNGFDWKESIHQSFERLSDAWAENLRMRLENTLHMLTQTSHAWYSRIEEFLLGLDFTKTVANPNHYYYFRVDLLVLFLHVSDLSYEKLIAWSKKWLASKFNNQHGRHWPSVLFLQSRGLANSKWDLPQAVQACNQNSEKISDDVSYTHGYSYHIKSSVIRRFGRSICVQALDWFLYIPGEYQTWYLFCNIHFETVYGWAMADSRGCYKTHAPMLEGQIRIDLRYVEMLSWSCMIL